MFKGIGRLFVSLEHGAATHALGDFWFRAGSGFGAGLRAT